MMKKQNDCVSTQVICFPALPEGMAEYHATLQIQDGSLSFEEQLRALIQAYSEVTAGKTVLLRRFFLSDPANQEARLKACLETLPAAATSLVGQAPLNGTKIAAWLYAVPGGMFQDGVFSHNGYEHLWLGGMTSGNEGSQAQMADMFHAYEASLSERGMTVADNCLRTWIFVRDVDVNYGGVVKGRRDYFNGIGLTPDTHFIASTGIAGYSGNPRQLVMMDTYAVKGLKEEQIRYLHAYDHLSPTALYGVTFERGTAVTYGDRKHVFISGTASIDKDGQIVHGHDPEKQAGRMLENVDALLKEAGAAFRDIAYGIVYLRDASDYPRVRTVIRQALPALDPIYVLAPVCRPGWLVEMECMAITAGGDHAFSPF